jgi:hypothetical protein
MQEEQLTRRNRVFTAALAAFSAIWLICTGVNLATGSEYYYISGLGTVALSVMGVAVGLWGFRATLSRRKAGVVMYAVGITMYAVSFITGIVVISFLEYREYLSTHSWELKTSISLAALAVFLVFSACLCGFGSYIAVRLSSIMLATKPDSQELEPIVDRQEEDPWGATLRNPMTAVPE